MKNNRKFHLYINTFNTKINFKSMKKYLLVISLFMASYCANSQDLKSITLYTYASQFDKAKVEVDGFLANEKNAAKPEGWYYKAYIYNGLGRTPGKPVAESKSLYVSAFDALKKYVAIDPKVPLTIEEKNSTVFNIYYGIYDLGIKTYNEKNYEESYDLFTKALGVHDYIYDNKITGPNNLKAAAHDTDLVWNLAVLANELKKKDDALMYFKKIADADLKDEKYATAYDELVIKYKKEKNAAEFAKYVAAAKKNYPVDIPYWEMKEMEYALDGLEDEALLNKYEELTKAMPNNYIVFYNYAVEIDKYLSSNAAKAKDAAAVSAYRTKIEELYKKAVSLKSTLEANLQLANLYYSKTFDLQERIAKIKGTKPAEVKLKNDLIAESKALSLASIPYAEAAVGFLSKLEKYKFSDKSNYKLALEILGNGYKVAGNAAKVAEVEKKKLEVEKL